MKSARNRSIGMAGKAYFIPHGGLPPRRATLVVVLLQTFVFARVLSPSGSRCSFLSPRSVAALSGRWRHRKVLFVNLRRRFRNIGRSAASRISRPSLSSSILRWRCLPHCCASPYCAQETRRQRTGIVFLFNAVNLPWLALRNINITIDEFSTLKRWKRRARPEHRSVAGSAVWIPCWRFYCSQRRWVWSFSPPL